MNYQRISSISDIATIICKQFRFCWYKIHNNRLGNCLHYFSVKRSIKQMNYSNNTNKELDYFLSHLNPHYLHTTLPSSPGWTTYSERPLCLIPSVRCSVTCYSSELRLCSCACSPVTYRARPHSAQLLPPTVHSHGGTQNSCNHLFSESC